MEELIFVQLFTDEGITGFGEATGGLATKPNLGRGSRPSSSARTLPPGASGSSSSRRALHRSTGFRREAAAGTSSPRA